MVVLEERAQLRDAIVAYMRGEIDNFAFDDRIFAFKAKDDAVRHIRRTCWTTYDDLKKHRFSRPGASLQVWQFYRRAIAYLETPTEWTPPSERDGKSYPFATFRDVLHVRPDLSLLGLPPRANFRPARPRTPWQRRRGHVLTGLQLASVLSGLSYLAYVIGDALYRWFFR